MSEPGFDILPRRPGFHMTFENGYCVSVQFGAHNYCEKRDSPDEHWPPPEGAVWASADAEVAIFYPREEEGRRRFVKLENHDDVTGWKSPTEVLRIMTWAANQGAPPTLKEVSDAETG